MVNPHASTAGGMGSIPGQVTKILHALWCGKKKKEKEVKHTENKQKKAFFIYSSLFTNSNMVVSLI